MALRLCVICKENKTERLMDGGWGEMLPVCTPCLASGRERELLQPKAEKPKKPKTVKPKTEEAPSEGGGVSNYLCPECKGVTHRPGSKIHKRHLKLLNK